MNKKYTIPTKFSQQLRPCNERFLNDLKLNVNFDNGLFSGSVSMGKEEKHLTETFETRIEGNSAENYYSYATNTLNLKVGWDVDLKHNSVVYLTEMQLG